MPDHVHPDARPGGPGSEPAPTVARDEPRRQSAPGDLRHLLSIAGPNVASTASETVMSFIDYAIVSALGAAAQAAVSSGTMIYFSVFGLLLGMMVCVTTVVSQSLGAGRPRDCAVYGWQGIWLSLIFGTIGVLVWPLVPGFFALVGHEPEVQGMEVDFTRIRLCGLALAGMAVVLGHFFNGIHQPRINAYTVAASVVLNAVLTYGLVLGKWGLPAMGVAGAALGTVIANGFRVAWLLIAMMWSRSAARFEARRAWPLNLDKMRRLVRVGLPSGLSFMLDITAWATLLVVIIGRFGTESLAATATCWRFTELSFMPAVGIGIAVATLVGRSIGQGRADLARRWAWIGTAINMTYMGLMGLVFIVFGRPLMELFSDDAEVIRLGVRFLIFSAIFQLFDAVAITYVNALRGAGDTRWPAVVFAVLSWGFMVGVSTLLALLRPQWGSTGPWVCSTLAVIIGGVLLAGRWRSGAWEKLDVIGRVLPDPVTVEASPFEQYPVMPIRAEAPPPDGTGTCHESA
ncbi:MAG TPA: MATE family efflux transporter [Phycisphaerae bacterium]|nr:MATE family efflux transporter [Phycisphaerae bacterium]